MFPKILLSIPLAMILVSPSCQNRFQNGIIEITDAHGTRTLHSEFHNGQLGRIGHGAIFRAQLQDGSTVMIENKEAVEPEEHK